MSTNYLFVVWKTPFLYYYTLQCSKNTITSIDLIINVHWSDIYLLSWGWEWAVDWAIDWVSVFVFAHLKMFVPIDWLFKNLYYSKQSTLSLLLRINYLLICCASNEIHHEQFVRQNIYVYTLKLWQSFHCLYLYRFVSLSRCLSLCSFFRRHCYFNIRLCDVLLSLMRCLRQKCLL